MNASVLNLSFDRFVLPGETLKFSELVADYCSQLEGKIMLMLLVIMTLYVYRVFMLKLGLRGIALLVGKNFEKFVWLLHPYIESFLDTGALISSVFILYLFSVQNQFRPYHKVWIGLLVVAVVVCFLSAVYLKKDDRDR